ncbi:hypothetical protein LTR84_003047 [Exophiala bonariae]|uniref:Deacetylase sirtuin-type domain-containing protein n=1 Tax=Exophiala bonariae TaxID=1690606 RepID=A0AAV9NBD0_9EURO|nr:hypothetical protein LTR84_003047 [Exophiala bonariae]
MTSSAPHSPARYRDVDTDSNASPSRPSPAKLLRIQQIEGDPRASSLPPRRIGSPAKKVQVRPRLNQFYTIDHAVSLLKASKNIVVLTGAGISTSLGVPDFRSKDGVYDLLEGSPYADPQDLFHIDNFKADPRTFFKQARKIFPKMQGLVPSKNTRDGSKSTEQHSVPKYSTTHAFLSLLQAKNKLLTNYTQNIDGLEAVAGISSSKLIHCHGTLSTATCMSCGKQVSARKYMPVVHAGGLPVCKCSLQDDPKTQPRRSMLPRGRSGKKKRKRYEYEDTDSEEDQQPFEKGLLKPDMTFFGEQLSNTYGPRLQTDKRQIDLLVIIGTSLKVNPVNEIPFKIPPTVPQIWISKERCQREGVKVDIELLGECDLIVDEICRRAGWSSALNDRKWTPEKAELKRLKEKDSNLNLKNSRDLSSDSSMMRTKIRKAMSATSRSPAVKSKKQTLEMRPKVADRTPTIKLNGKDLPAENNGDLGQNQSLVAVPVPPAIKLETSGSDPELAVKRQASVPPLPKVSIELELGTHSRWFVKRAT